MANLGGPLASRKWKVGDRVESVANGKPTGCFGTVVGIPKEGRSQVHFFVTIRWDEPKFGAIESKISPAALIEVERRENPARKPERGFVYWNLHKDLYSIRVTGKPVTAATAVRVRDADLVVQPGGRKRVLETKQKSVHAGVRGEVEIADDFKIPGKGWIRVRYDPYKYASFVRVDNEDPVLESPEVIMVIREGRPRVYAKESASAKANPEKRYADNPTVNGWKLVKRTTGKLGILGGGEQVRPGGRGPIFEQWKRGQYILTLTRDEYRGFDVVDVEVRGPHGDTGVYGQWVDIASLRLHAMVFANHYMDLPAAEQATGEEDPNWLWEGVNATTMGEELLENPRQKPPISTEEIEFHQQATARGYDPDARGRIFFEDGRYFQILGFSDDPGFPIIVWNRTHGGRYLHQLSRAADAALRLRPKPRGQQTRLPPPVVPPRSENPRRLKRMMNPRSY